MRLGRVIGRVTLSVTVPSFVGARWLLISPLSRQQYAERLESTTELSKEPSLVAYDELGAGLGQTIGFIEGREAACPFAQPPPVDAISAALVDEIYYSPFNS
jgi:carbon dioxide concentrating mechanism protein CcmL